MLCGGMETENTGALDLHAEYLRTLRAVRVAAAVLIVCCASWCWQQYRQVEPLFEIIENRTGNFRNPYIIDLVADNAPMLGTTAPMVAVACLAYVLFAARTVSHLVYAAIVGAGTCAIAGQFLSLGVMESWREMYLALERAWRLQP